MASATPDAPPPETLPFPDMDSAGSHLVETVDGARLLGSRCKACGGVSFPRRFTCLTCGARALEDEVMPHTGTLYSYSTVHISSSYPTPYTLGYVDLSNGVRLLSHIEGGESGLAIDAPVMLKPVEAGFVFVVQSSGAGQ